MTSQLYYDIKYIYLNVNVKYLWRYKLVGTLQIRISLQTSFTTKLAFVVLYMRLDKRLLYGYMYTWSSVRRATRLNTTASCCLCAQTIIMCGGKAVCARTGCTQYIRNSTSKYFCLRERPFSTGRRGHIGVMSVYEMSHSERSLRWCKDCKNIFCGSWDMIFLKY